MRVPFWGFSVLFWIIAATPSGAFVVEAGNTPHVDPREALAIAPRWSMSDAALADGGAPGLGGGLEISIDESVCRELKLIDPAPCSEIRALLVGAANRWTEDHPVLRFVDVSDRVPVKILPDDVVASPGAMGAEIDVAVEDAELLTGLHSARVAADARNFYLQAVPVIASNGAPLPRARGRVVSADIRLNRGMCFYLDPAHEREACMHLPSVMMHEITHVLGLDHPDERPHRNLARTTGAACDYRPVRFRLHPEHDHLSVSNGHWTGPGYWVRGLSDDDRAGRDALYPPC